MWSVRRLPGERMWVRITHREGSKLTRTLENWPVFVYLNPGDIVTFDIDDIIDYDYEGEQMAA